MFIHSILEIIMLETDSNVFVDDIIESFLKEICRFRQTDGRKQV